MTPDTAPSSSHRTSSSGVVCGSDRAKKPPMSEPHRLTPLSPMVKPLYNADCRPSKPHPVVGSPPQTICECCAVRVQPLRLKRASGRGADRE